jgi:hypothetical protein
VTLPSRSTSRLTEGGRSEIVCHGDDLMHTTTSGLFAGVRARQVAERSFEYSAGFLPGPQ